MNLQRAEFRLTAYTFLLALTVGSLAMALDVPPLPSRVNDLAGMMPPSRARELEERLQRFEQETGHQIAVLTIPSLEGEDLEGFSIKVAEAWKIGQKSFDNGVILLIARDDRKIRIEVGYGLEGILPDAIASRIIREIIAPRFRQSDYAGGIEVGIDAMMKAARGEKIPASERGPAKHLARNDDLIGGVFFFGLLIAFLAGRLMIAATRRQGILRGVTVGSFIGTLSGAMVLFLGAGLGLAVVILAGAIVTSALGILFEMSTPGWSTGAGRRRRGGWREPFYSGGYDGGRGGGGNFGGGFDGGGFSGGGGGFGGGGASGGW